MLSERFRKVFLQPLMVSHIILLTTWIISLLILSASRFEISWSSGVTFWVAGWIIWTLAEYFLNRYLLHFRETNVPILDSIVQYHSMHHDDPDDVHYVFIHPLVVGFTAAPLMVGSFLMVGETGLVITSGFLFGYLWFAILHALQHHYTSPSTGFLKRLWQHHYLHHQSTAHSAYGVTTSFWDLVFRSLPPKHQFLMVNPVNMKAVSTSWRIVEVNDSKTKKIFLDLPESIYANDPGWVPYVKSEIKNIFDPAVNPYFMHGTVKRWILVNEAGRVSGRIAAFVDFRKLFDNDNRVGSIGFFECAGGEAAAFTLFDVAVDWLVKYFKVTAVQGPVNFGENDKYWGLLIKGFTAPSYGMNYHRPAYFGFFEEYGFQIHYRQLTNYLDLTKPLPERFTRIAERISKNERYDFRPFSHRESNAFVQAFVAIYNLAWSSFDNFRPIDEKTVRKSLAEMKPIMEEDFVWFAYADNKPVGFVLIVPDANEILSHCGDISHAWGKLKFIFYKYRIGFSRLRVVVMGIVPEFQNRGLESALIMKASEVAKKKPHYKHVELSWVGDFNEKMIAIHKAMGAVEDKQHATFRKIL